MKLWLLRHADSALPPRGGTDFDRPLSAAGRADCERMAARLGGCAARADCMISSDARRALMTARALAPAFGVSVDRILPDHRLYHATPTAMIDVIREAPPDVEALAIVGHNPGISELVALLVDIEFRRSLPTLGIVAVLVRSDWASLHPGAAVFDTYIEPHLV